MREGERQEDIDKGGKREIETKTEIENEREIYR